MANKLVYYGQLNNDKNKELFNKALSSIEKGNYNFYYLFPNGELLTRYRERFIEKTVANLAINLFTFDDIVEEILMDEDYEIINEEVKLFIIKSVIKKLNNEGKLKNYSKIGEKQGFIKSISTIIGTIKRSLIYEEDFKYKTINIGKYKEIGLIYEYYQKYLKDEGLVDREELYFMAIDKLENEDLSLDKIEFIIIDEFYDFRPIELKLLEKISELELDIYINMPFKFKSDFKIIEDTLSYLEELDFKIIDVERKEDEFIELGENFFGNSWDRIETDSKTEIIIAPNEYLEIKKVFENIKKEMNKGVDLNEMCITILEDEYLDMVVKVADEEKLPISIDKKYNLIDFKIIEEVLVLIRLTIDKNFKDALLNRLRLKYFKLSNDHMIDKIYIFLKYYEFNSMEDLLNKLNDEKIFNVSEDILREVSSILYRIEEEMNIFKNNNIESINEALFQIFDDYKLTDQIKEIAFQDIYKFKESQDIYLKLEEILYKLSEYSDLIGNIDMEIYYELLLNNLKEEEISLRKGNPKGIQVFKLIDNRGFEFKNNYIPGLSQDKYPKIVDKNFLINERNYKELKDIGLYILNQDLKLENEMIKFASVIAGTKNKLVLSYSKGEDGSNVASIFLDEILRLIGNDIKINEISLDYLLKENIDEITTKEDMEKLVLNSIFENKNENKEYIYDYLKNNKEKMELIDEKNLSQMKRNEENYNEYSGNINSPYIERYMKEYNKNRIYSSSFLEFYAKCPYRFLLGRILNVEEIYEKMEDYDPLLIGNIYHKVLRVFYENESEEIRDRIKGKENIDRSVVKDRLKSYFMKIIREENIKIKNKKHELLLEDIFERLEEFLYKDLDRLEKFRLLPWEFEKAFGDERDFKISKGKDPIYIRGIIDRIDKNLENQSLIMDYKMGSNNYRLKDMEEGLSLQLPIYLMAMEDKDPLIAMYGEINSGNFQLGLSLSDESFSAKGIRNNKIVDSLEKEEFFQLITEEIFKIRENILNGNFKIDPKECPDYCDYKNICRYEKKVQVIEDV